MCMTDGDDMVEFIDMALSMRIPQGEWPMMYGVYKLAKEYWTDGRVVAAEEVLRRNKNGK